MFVIHVHGLTAAETLLGFGNIHLLQYISVMDPGGFGGASGNSPTSKYFSPNTIFPRNFEHSQSRSATVNKYCAKLS